MKIARDGHRRQLVSDTAFHYTDKSKNSMVVYNRAIRAGEEITVPQKGLGGMSLLLPPQGD